MMRRGGPRNKPTVMHLLQNTVDGSRHAGREFEPVPGGSPGEAPEDFNAAERKEWDYIRDNAPTKLFKSLDRRALIGWCKACVLYDEANAELRTSGMLVKSSRGNPMKSPLLGIISDQLKHIRILAEQLGFTPSGRSRIQIEKDAGVSDWAKLKQLKTGTAGLAAHTQPEAKAE